MRQSIADKAHQLGALTLAEAALLSGIDGVELARAVVNRSIRVVMVEGIAHIPAEALEEYCQSRVA